MSTLLHIDSSPLGEGSISRHLTAVFVREWSAAHPGSTVIVRDVVASTPPPIDGMWVGAAYTPAEYRTPEQRHALRVSDELLAEMRRADHYVFGVPMHNFGVPSTLKLWIDQVVRVGEAFQYGERGPVGLITGKKATVVTSSGGVFGPEAASLSMNFVEPYLRLVLGFIGVHDVDFMTAAGAAQLVSGAVDRETFLKPHVEAIRARFAA